MAKKKRAALRAKKGHPKKNGCGRTFMGKGKKKKKSKTKTIKKLAGTFRGDGCD